MRGRHKSQRYQCEYRAVLFAGRWRHDYRVICRHGAMNFHWTDMGEDEGKYPSSAGLESHYSTPPDYMKDHAPHHSPCPLLGAPCWHDGTSLYATDTLLPQIRGASLDEAFSILCYEAGKRFDEDDQ